MSVDFYADKEVTDNSYSSPVQDEDTSIDRSHDPWKDDVVKGDFPSDLNLLTCLSDDSYCHPISLVDLPRSHY